MSNSKILSNLLLTLPIPTLSFVCMYIELSEDMPGVVFLKVDVDENPDTAAKYGVSAMPTFVFIKKGEVVDRLMGANPAALQEKCSDLA